MRRTSESDLLPSACRSKGVLALDLASKTGWAFAPPSSVVGWPGTRPFADVGLVAADPRPPASFGTIVTGRPGSSHGERAAALDEWLEAMHERSRLGLVVVEQPMPAKFSKNMAATEIAIGLRMIVQAFCARRGIAGPWEVPIISAKSWFGSKLQKDKRPMIATAKSLGWDVGTDHEADALAILDLVLARAVNAGRLIGRAA